MLVQATLYAHITARDLGQIELIGAACLTQIWITFAHRQIAWTLFGVALCLAPATREPILTIAAAIAEFFAVVLCSYARALFVAWTFVLAR